MAEHGETLSRRERRELNEDYKPAWFPETKTAYGAFAGAFTVLVVWVASLSGLEVPGEVASAFTTILTMVIVYFIPNKKVWEK